MGSTTVADGQLLGAIEGQVHDGPWTDIKVDVDKVNALVRWTGTGDELTYGITAMYFDANWNSADQIPERAVKQGLIDPLGSLDKTLGGNTRRMSLSGTLSWDGDNFLNEINAWIIDYFYASRLPQEPATGVEDIHYHIFEPRQARVSATWMF